MSGDAQFRDSELRVIISCVFVILSRIRGQSELEIRATCVMSLSWIDAVWTSENIRVTAFWRGGSGPSQVNRGASPYLIYFSFCLDSNPGSPKPRPCGTLLCEGKEDSTPVTSTEPLRSHRVVASSLCRLWPPYSLRQSSDPGSDRGSVWFRSSQFIGTSVQQVTTKGNRKGQQKPIMSLNP